MFGALIAFAKTLVARRETLWAIAWRDLKVRYVGSYLGILWVFLQPAMTVLLLWFVFGIGFRSQPLGELPFILWLLPAYIPWLFIADCLVAGATSVRENSYLVQKIVFPVAILPVTKILAGLIVHSLLTTLLILILILNNHIPGWAAIQIIYYACAASLLLLGIGWAASAVNVFIRDLGQAMQVLVQLAFWATPIFWSASILPAKYHRLLNLNPFYYITEGYRNALIHNRWFWDLEGTYYFWPICLAILLFGAYLFKKLRPHFADVL